MPVKPGVPVTSPCEAVTLRFTQFVCAAAARSRSADCDSKPNPQCCRSLFNKSYAAFSSLPAAYDETRTCVTREEFSTTGTVGGVGSTGPVVVVVVVVDELPPPPPQAPSAAKKQSLLPTSTEIRMSGKVCRWSLKITCYEYLIIHDNM